MKLSIAAVGLTVVIALGACQDDGPKTSTLSKAEFLEEADAICADFATQLAAQTASSSAPMGDGGSDRSSTSAPTPTVPGDATGTVSVRDELIDLTSAYEQVVDDIRSIGFPEDEADVLDDLLSDLDSAIDELATEAEDIDPNAGPSSLNSVNSTIQKLSDALSALRTYGFDRCAIA